MFWQRPPPHFRLDVHVEDVGGIGRTTISGDVRPDMGVEELRQTLQDLLRTGHRVHVQIDLHGRRLIDLVGARAIDAAEGEAAVHRSHLDLVAGSPASVWLFALLDTMTDASATRPMSERPEDDTT
jgi:hypothetical protein